MQSQGSRQTGMSRCQSCIPFLSLSDSCHTSLLLFDFKVIWNASKKLSTHDKPYTRRHILQIKMQAGFLSREREREAKSLKWGCQVVFLTVFFSIKWPLEWRGRLLVFRHSKFWLTNMCVDLVCTREFCSQEFGVSMREELVMFVSLDWLSQRLSSAIYSLDSLFSATVSSFARLSSRQRFPSNYMQMCVRALHLNHQCKLRHRHSKKQIRRSYKKCQCNFLLHVNVTALSVLGETCLTWDPFVFHEILLHFPASFFFVSQFSFFVGFSQHESSHISLRQWILYFDVQQLFFAPDKSSWPCMIYFLSSWLHYVCCRWQIVLLVICSRGRDKKIVSLFFTPRKRYREDSPLQTFLNTKLMNLTETSWSAWPLDYVVAKDYWRSWVN